MLVARIANYTQFLDNKWYSSCTDLEYTLDVDTIMSILDKNLIRIDLQDIQHDMLEMQHIHRTCLYSLACCIRVHSLLDVQSCHHHLNIQGDTIERARQTTTRVSFINVSLLFVLVQRFRYVCVVLSKNLFSKK
jgi:hypothetical protein